MEWVASTLHTTLEHGVSSIITANAHTSAASSRLLMPPADLNGLVRFAERQNLVSARVPSYFKRSLLNAIIISTNKHSGMDKNKTASKTRNSPATLAQPFVGFFLWLQCNSYYEHTLSLLCDLMQFKIPKANCFK